MFTSTDRDDFDDHSFLGHHESFPSYQDQQEFHLNHHHHQLSMFNLSTPYNLPRLAEDQFDYVPGQPGPDAVHELDLIMFHHPQQQQQKERQGEAAMGFVVDGDGNDKGVAVEVEKRAAVAPGRSSKKDRHSKITTARGPRDRRMRLSLEVAREFFDLQDMLGFDKASQTVEWLISQSKSAIKEIIRKVKGNDGIAASYASDCEIGFDRNSNGYNGGRAMESSAGWTQSKKERKARQSRRRDSHQWLISATRDSRMKARERARERTLEKLWKRSLEGSSLNNPRKPYTSSVEAGEESSCIQDQTAATGSNLDIFTQCEEIAGMAGRMSIDVSSSDLGCGKWNSAEASSSNLNLQEMGGVPQCHQLRSREQFFKQWEAYSNYGFDPS